MPADPPGPPDAPDVQDSPGSPGRLADLGLPPLVARVLRSRGMEDPDLIRRFWEPRLTDLHFPALLAGVDAAAVRLVEALKRNEQIVIYGDYDVDGITASAILFHVIRAVQPAARVRTYVPHRLEEGYGLNCEALRQLRAEGADLVISVDCGVTAHRSAATAREIGLDLVITDHHNLPPEGQSLPDALAIVHPGLPGLGGAPYPFRELCGAGVAFKLAWRFATAWCNSERVSQRLQQTLLDMLPLVALGTIADVVPLVDENRVLAAHGLRLIKKTRLAGLRALIDASDLAGERIDSEKVGFHLAPRLNACGRMGHAAEAVHMLTTASPDEAMAIAIRLCEQNVRRQSMERTIFDQAARMAEDSGMLRDDHRAILLAHESWHPGVVGIVCSRLVDRFGRPSVLLNKAPDLCKGSARSIDGYSIHDGLASARRYMASFGGHAMAAGLSLLPEHLEDVRRSLVEHANGHIEPECLTPSLRIDCDAMMAELDESTVRRLDAMAPFGRSNRSPSLRLTNTVLQEPPRQMGDRGRHLSLQLRQDHGGARRFIRAVWWSAGPHAADLAAGMRLDVAIEPKINVWNDRVSVEARILDVMVREPAATA